MLKLKNKKMSTKAISIIMSLVLLFVLSFPVVASAHEAVSTQTQNLNRVFENKIETIQHPDQELTIRNIKNVQDFSGHKYIVVECSPSGYMIYSPDSGVFVEVSPSAPSPYEGIFGKNLYYAGPTAYYELINNVYVHTITDEKISMEDRVPLIDISNNMAVSLENVKDVALLDYVQNGEEIAYQSSRNVIKPASTGGLSADKINWFKGLTECGYVSGLSPDGVCGFIGLGMLYAFFDKFVDNKFMDDTYWKNSGKTLLKGGNESFSAYLYHLDPKDTTTSMHIHSVSKKYLSQKGISNIDHTSRYYPAFTDGTVTGIIDDGYPVEVFGMFVSPSSQKTIAHAVVAYKYTNYVVTPMELTCHFGYNNYSEVILTGVMGSIYAMEKK